MKNSLLRYSIDANSLVEKGEYDRCLDLISHIFDLSQQFQTPNYFKEFFWLFYKIFNSRSSTPVDRFWSICDLIFKPSQPDHKRDTSYLLEVILKVKKYFYSEFVFSKKKSLF